MNTCVCCHREATTVVDGEPMCADDAEAMRRDAVKIIERHLSGETTYNRSVIDKARAVLTSRKVR